MKFRTLTYRQSWNIHNPDRFKNPTYSELSQKFKMDCFGKIVKSYNCFSKVLYLRSLAGFWIRHFLNKYSLTWRVNSHYVLYDIYSMKPVCYRKSTHIRHVHVLFRHIQPCCDIFRTLRNSYIIRNLPDSELCITQNFGICRTRGHI